MKKKSEMFDQVIIEMYFMMPILFIYLLTCLHTYLLTYLYVCLIALCTEHIFIKNKVKKKGSVTAIDLKTTPRHLAELFFCVAYLRTQITLVLINPWL